MPPSTRPRAPTHRALADALSLLAAALAAGCKTPDAGFTWVEDYRQPACSSMYTIAPGDTLSVRVYNQEGMSAKVKVRTDGMISLPFVNDVDAAGDTPAMLAERVQARLKAFVVNPVVTVSLDEARPLEVSVVGEVLHPGIYRLDPSAGVLSALASAGGFGTFADKDRIFVVRGGTLRIRFTYTALRQGRGQAGKFCLRPGDVIIFE